MIPAIPVPRAKCRQWREFIAKAMCRLRVKLLRATDPKALLSNVLRCVNGRGMGALPALFLVGITLPADSRATYPSAASVRSGHRAVSAAPARARWPRFPLLPNGRFPISGWCAPPIRETNDVRYEEYAKAGFTVALFALEDNFLRESNLERLPVAGRHGIYVVIRDRRVDPDETTRSGWRARVDSVVSSYRSHSSLLAYFLADEPAVPLLPALGTLTRRFAEKDPLHPTYVNLYGCPSPGGAYGGLPFSAYLRRFVDQARPSFFSIDQYVLRQDGDNPMFCAGMDTARLVSTETGVPFWAILQLTTHGPFRKLTEGELAWQANLALAHGARGIVWFTYWSPNPRESLGYRDGPIAYDGRRNPSYDSMARLNPRIEALGRELEPLTVRDVVHTGILPVGGRPLTRSTGIRLIRGGDLALGEFWGSSSFRYVLVVNRDYRHPQEILLSCRASVERFTGRSRTYRRIRTSEGRFSLHLEPGGAELIRMRGRG